MRQSLLEQFQYQLLLLVGLGQSGDARLFQDGVLGQVGDRRRNVGGPDAVFGTGEVLHLVVDDAGGALKAVDGSADGAPECGDLLDGGVDGGQSSGGIGLS